MFDKEELEKKAADIIADNINDMLTKQDKVVFAVPSGRSVAGIFKNLKEKKIPWKKVHVFMVDERFVPIEDDESNFKLAKDNFIDGLLSKGILPKQNVHPFIINDT